MTPADKWRRQWERTCAQVAALAVFERVKHRLRATSRLSITEALQEYLHNHPEEIGTELERVLSEAPDYYGAEDPDAWRERMQERAA